MTAATEQPANDQTSRDLPLAELAETIDGMGPIVLDHGVAFRVWAPHADAVAVVGSFNDWDTDAAPMVRNDNGHWFALVEQARPGDEYQYAITTGEHTRHRIDPRVRQVTNSVGNGLVHDPHFDWQGDDFTMPPWNELVIYETHIGTFFRGEPGGEQGGEQGDGQGGGQGVGTFDDYAERFDHLRRLGINAIQVMPIAEFAGDLSWGYNPAHPYAIESAYGGPVAFKRFVRAAHKAGFAVILDVVYNHFGPSDLDLWQFDGWTDPNHPDKGGIYFYNDDRSITPWGDTRPDYGRGEVRTYIRDNALMWLEDYRVDGLRYDMTLYIRSVDASGAREIPEGWSLTQWVNREVHAFRPSALTIAEDLQDDARLTQPEEQGGAGFSTQWDAAFVHPMREVLTQVDDSSRDMNKVQAALSHAYNGDPFERVVYTESHDEVANGKSRVPSEIDSDDTDAWHVQKRTTLGLAMVLTAPGIPMLFQGQEFLEDGWFQDQDELNWDQAADHDGIISLTARLVRLRLDRDGVTAGLTGRHLDLFHQNDADKVVAFRRWRDGGRGDECVVVANFANRHYDRYRIGLPAGGRWRRRISTDRSQYSEVFAGAASGDLDAAEHGYDGQPFSGELTLPPYTALVYSQDADR